LRAERDGHTLQPTALVNEAWLRLMNQHDPIENRLQFFGVAALAMRRILVDHARKRKAFRRGSDMPHVPLDDELPSPLPDDRLIALDEALQRLAALDPRHARVVELRYFGGLSIAEVADALAVSPGTVKRDWRTARAWLFDEMRAAANQ
jgi:RNA polymerase sigma factor (TIGR02999 family)